MRGKPYLEIEIDEHSSDVGAVTRLEAFLDSLKNVDRPRVAVKACSRFSGRTDQNPEQTKNLYPLHDRSRSLPWRRLSRSCGVEAEMLPPSDEETLRLGRQLTSRQGVLSLAS